MRVFNETNPGEQVNDFTDDLHRPVFTERDEKEKDDKCGTNDKTDDGQYHQGTEFTGGEQGEPQNQHHETIKRLGNVIEDQARHQDGNRRRRGHSVFAHVIGLHRLTTARKRGDTVEILAYHRSDEGVPEFLFRADFFQNDMG